MSLLEKTKYFGVPRSMRGPVSEFMGSFGTSGELPKFRSLSFRWFLKGLPIAKIQVSQSRNHQAARFQRLFKILFLALVYSSARQFFTKNQYMTAVVWGGVGGTRGCFIEGARDARASCVHMELSPIPETFTLDQCGVNHFNSLPRKIDPYRVWASLNGVEGESWRNGFRALEERAPSVEYDQYQSPHLPGLKDTKFVFVPTQVPTDTQIVLFGKEFKKVDDFVEAVSEAGKYLPDGWHIRIREHPSAKTFLDRKRYEAYGNVFFDNRHDCFSQLEASLVVITQNSSVGLQAMAFDKPVIVSSECFWAIPEIVHLAQSKEAIVDAFKAIEKIGFSEADRNAFLNFLVCEYYPPKIVENEALRARIIKRLSSDASEPSWIEKL